MLPVDLKKLCGIIAAMSLGTLAVNAAANAEAEPVQVKTSLGTLEGFKDAQRGLDLFLGVPFAQPPVGELRWKAPQPLEPWDGIREAKQFGPRPVQANVFGDMRFRSPSMSEDCLYLNIWAPADAVGQGKKLPVLLYFYGGGFVAGGGSEPRYDGAAMAEKGVVSVTCNYRLNIFGFLSHPELSEEAPYHGSGNYGLLDQNAALKWVRDNIAAFGGDPDHITIAGESAGSISVSAQMASPLSRDLIAGAIGESGAAVPPTLAPVPLSQAEAEGEAFLEAAGINGIADARAMSTEQIFAAYLKSGRFGFPSAIDGYFYPKGIVEIFKAGEQAQVPLLVGWNSAEMVGAAFMQGASYTKKNFVTRVKAEFPEDADAILSAYPHETKEEVEQSATDLASDRFIVYATWKWFDLHRKHSDEPVYRYLFSRIRPPLKDKDLVSGLAGGTMKKKDAAKTPKPYGAPHASEIEYVLGNTYIADEYAWTDDDRKVSATALDYFANFVKTGNPNGDSLPQWPAAKPDDPAPAVMVLDLESKAVEAPRDGRFDVLDEHFGNK